MGPLLALARCQDEQIWFTTQGLYERDDYNLRVLKDKVI